MWSRDTVVSHDEVGGNILDPDHETGRDMVKMKLMLVIWLWQYLVTAGVHMITAWCPMCPDHTLSCLVLFKLEQGEKRQKLVSPSVVDWQWFIMMMFHDTDHDQLSPHNYLHCHCHRPWLTPLCHKDCRKLWKWTAMWRPVISIKSQFYHTFYPEIEATSRITWFCKTL